MINIGLNLGPATPGTSAPTGPAPHVFIVAGESNASGRAPEDDAQTFPAGTREWGAANAWTVPGSRLYHAPWESGAIARPDVSANFGWARSFANAHGAANPGHPVYLIGVAREGSGLENGQWTPGNAAWNGALARINAALANAPANAVLKGILWHQGETDGQTTTGRDGYAAALGQLVTNLRAAITGAGPTTAFVAGGHFPASTHFQAKIQAACQALPNQLAHCGYADPSTPQEVQLSDGRHVDAAGVLALGQSYHAAFVQAQANASLSSTGVITTGTLTHHSLPSTLVSTLAGISLGSAAANRAILVAIVSRRSTPVFPRAVSINGIALSRVGAYASGASVAGTALYFGQVPDAATGTLSVTFNVAPTSGQAGAIVLPAYGLRPHLSLAAGHSVVTLGNGVASIGTTVTAQAGDLIFAAAGSNSSPAAAGTMNLAQTITGPAAATTLALTGGAALAAAGAQTVTCTFNRAVNAPSLNVAVFRPA